MRKDTDRLQEEKRDLCNRRVQALDESISAQYSDSVNQCHSIFSTYISGVFDEETKESLNYQNVILCLLRTTSTSCSQITY